MSLATQDTAPHGIPVVAPSAALQPRHAAQVVAPSGWGDLMAWQAAGPVMQLAQEKGLPAPQQVATVGGRVEVSVVFPAHYLQWISILDGLGHADERDRPEFDPARQDMPRVWVTALPNHARGDLSLHGWTEVAGDGDTGGNRRQQWVLRPVYVQGGCLDCDKLPEPREQFVSVESYRAETWYRLVGKRWDEETGPRAHTVNRGDGRQPSPRRRTAVTS